MTPEEQAKALVDMIAGKFATRADAERELLSHGFCADDTEYILDTIDMACSRATMHGIGLPLANMSSNVDDDPIFKAALAHFLRGPERMRSETGSKPLPMEPESAESVPLRKKPWWKFW